MHVQLEEVSVGAGFYFALLHDPYAWLCLGGLLASLSLLLYVSCKRRSVDLREATHDE